MNATSSSQAPASPRPWWHYRMMWLVLGGPALVVAAAIATAVIAIHGADLVLDGPGAGPGAAPHGSHAPAVKARNHAVTPKAP